MEKNKIDTRVQKWMKYREEILENKNIGESLVNTDPKFKIQYNNLLSIFSNIDFFEDNDENFFLKIDSVDLKTQTKILEIDKILEEINIKERAKGRESIKKIKYDLNEYNKFIEKYFFDEYNNENSVKITKIDLGKKV